MPIEKAGALALSTIMIIQLTASPSNIRNIDGSAFHLSVLSLRPPPSSSHEPVRLLRSFHVRQAERPHRLDSALPPWKIEWLQTPSTINSDPSPKVVS